MSLAAGTRLGPYEILSPLGAGGMGEVYRARDTRLNRTVAIKVLPSHFADEPTVRQRFEREAHAVSSLNHPHICTLYDIGRQDGVDFLVLELLEGETLAARIEKGALPLDQALRYAAQIADALDRAHRQGVVHRDLKPGNIMLTKDGAKLLDFGLAKMQNQPADDETVTKALTAQGTILGTFQYMAPEQLEGKDADARTDIFAFGAVLYEMVTGRRAFAGKTQASVIAAILAADPPPLSTLQATCPPALEHLVKTCLAKDPEDRRQTIHDVKLELKWIAEGGGSQAKPSAPPSKLAWLPWILAAVILLAAAPFVIAYFRRAPEETRAVRSHILAPEKTSFTGIGNLAVSPDGRRLAFVAVGSDGANLVWVRSLDSLSAQSLNGTDGAAYPFWSPDSRFIGFFADSKVKKIEASGGPPITLCSSTRNISGGTWNRDGVIVFSALGGGPLYRVEAAGGEATLLTSLDRSRGETGQTFPSFLPDGRHFLYHSVTGTSAQQGVYVGSLDSKDVKRLVESGSSAEYGQGNLLFVRNDNLMAQPLDLQRLETAGAAVPVTEDVAVGITTGRAAFSVSGNGVLVYQTGGTRGDMRLTWFDRSGKKAGVLGDRSSYGSVSLSPNGAKAAVNKTGAQAGVWLFDVARDLPTRLTFDAAFHRYPVWSPDGSRIVFSSSKRNGHFELYEKASSGAGIEQLIVPSDVDMYATSWSPDGQFILYQTQGEPQQKLGLLPISGDRKPRVFLQAEVRVRHGQFSPDGRWIAYESPESGKAEVYVAPFPGPGGKRQISTGGGGTPRWRRDGKELFYLAPDRQLMAAEVNGKGGAFEIGAVRPLFRTRAAAPALTYDVTADGQRFLVINSVEEEESSPLTLVVNWNAGLKR
jgi:serine/threonine protein kinase/Tol biopolymer transport system component